MIFSNVNTSRTQFNVKDYGALGNSRKVIDAVLNGTTTVTSATGNFTAADVGKIIYGIETATGTARLPVGTVTAVASATSITVSIAATGSYSAIFMVLGTDDSDAIRLAAAAAQAASPRGVVYCPQGGYIFSKLLFDNRNGSLIDGISVRGDGMSQTIFFVHPSYSLASTASGKGLFHAITSCQNIYLQGFTVDGMRATLGASGYTGVQLGGSANSWVKDVYVTSFKDCTQNASVVEMTRGHILGLKTDFAGGSANLALNTNIGCILVDVFVSNGVGAGCRGMSIGSIAGEGDQGYELKFYGGLIDENGAESVQITSTSNDVAFFGTKFWGGNGQRAINITSSSKVKFFGCEIGPWNAQANSTGLKVDATSTAWLFGTRLVGTGTGYALDNAGKVYNLGSVVTSGNLNGTPMIQPPTPSMTTTQRDALAAAGGLTAGLMIYNSTTNKFNFYNGTAWEAVTSA